MGTSTWVLLIGLAVPRVVAAQPVGSEFQVNTYTTNYQARPAVAAAGTAGFVVVWDSYGQDGSFRGVYGQRFDASAAPEGVEFRVNTYTPSAQGLASVAGNAAGEYVVAWTSYQQVGSGPSVFLQRYDSAGTAMGGETQVNTYTTGDQKGAGVAIDPAGNVAVVWWSVSQEGSGEGIYTQRYDPGGTPIGGETHVNVHTTGQQWKPAVAADASGNFVVVWSSDEQDGDGHGVFARRLDGLGVPLGGDIAVNQYTTGEQTDPVVATDAAGNFVVAWIDQAQGGEDGVYGRHFDATGTPTGNELRVSAATVVTLSDPVIAGDGAGGYLVSWTGTDGDNSGIRARRLDATGVPAGVEMQVNTFTTSSQLHPAVGALSSGEYVIAWASSFQIGIGEDVFAQRIQGGLFFDGFETGDVCGWSATTVGATCPP